MLQSITLSRSLVPVFETFLIIVLQDPLLGVRSLHARVEEELFGVSIHVQASPIAPLDQVLRVQMISPELIAPRSVACVRLHRGFGAAGRDIRTHLPVLGT